MKVKSNFAACEIAGEYVVVPVGNDENAFHGMIKLNETGRAIWDAMQEETDYPALAAMLAEKFSVPQETALADVKEFVEKLKEVGCVD